ncbi:hemerythrin domain-containing protein [uncultured Thiodictyon sp.]|uniref:hemerythrin domain-containing protein n=1 Tax=uncultured Thiodictyon sp. TaxID=1846217 RepID=UPI0025D67989|nr:hemerythrin domain-containing protein [uncultured Thiodictyon sp.]
MQTLDGYCSTHSDLRQMIHDLRPLLTPDKLRIRPHARTAYQLLCDLDERVQSHLAEADCGLYPKLLIHDDPKVKSMAWGFISSEGALRLMFENYYKKWLKNADFNFSDNFLAETHQVFEVIDQRLDREEEVLMPKLLEIGMLHQAHA